MNVQFFFILNITPPTFFYKKNLVSNAQISVDKKTMLAKNHIMKCPLFPSSISSKVFHLTKVPTYKYGKYTTPLGNIIFL